LQVHDFIPNGDGSQQAAMGVSPQPLWRVILAGLIGNVMEWYDFALYGYFVGVFGKQFFPSSDPNASVIAAFGAFAAGFLVRPLGGVVLGRIGDRVGRKEALKLSVKAMAASTVLMAVLPTYQQIGLWAPFALILLRIIQGLSAGGEYTTSIVFLAEHAPNNRRGLITIWGLWGSVLGMLLGSIISSVLSSTLTASQIASWGWRLPFALGLLVALTGLLLRQGLHSEAPPGGAESPIRGLTRYRGAVLRVLFLNVAESVGFYTAFVYVIGYIQSEAGQSQSFALGLITRVMGLLLLFYPIMAWISDRLGRRPLLIAGSLLLVFGSVPIFMLLHSGVPTLINRGEILLMLTLALLAGAKNPANVELMPEAVRCTGLALAFNIAEGYFGGTTPLIAAWLVSTSGNPLLPGYWMAASGAVTLATVLWFTPETYRLPMRTL
jgi:MHS family proline/betaine transporter-like MFS transporter